MSKYTAEQVRDWHRQQAKNNLESELYHQAPALCEAIAGRHTKMADALDTLLRERESAKSAVTNKIVHDAAKVTVERGALNLALNVLRRAGKDEVANELAAACSEMLASARVLELENALRMVVAANAMLSEIEGGKTLYEGSPTHSTPCLLAWSNLNTAIANAKQVLAAAPKPNKPECLHEWAIGYGIADYCKKCGIPKPEKE